MDDALHTLLPLSPVDGLDVVYDRHFAPPARASTWFEALLSGIEWRQETVTVFGRRHLAPRLTAWYGDVGVRYRYAGIEHVASGWTDTLCEIRAAVERATAARFNAVLLNRYRDGRDTVGWHSDDEPSLGPAPVIASVSLGAARRLRFRPRPCHRAGVAGAVVDSAARRAAGATPHAGPRRAKTPELLLEHGSLMVMRGLTQACWQHSLPRCRRAGPRVSLTFRFVAPTF